MRRDTSCCQLPIHYKKKYYSYWSTYVVIITIIKESHRNFNCCGISYIMNDWGKVEVWESLEPIETYSVRSLSF